MKVNIERRSVDVPAACLAPGTFFTYKDESREESHGILLKINLWIRPLTYTMEKLSQLPINRITSSVTWSSRGGCNDSLSIFLHCAVCGALARRCNYRWLCRVERMVLSMKMNQWYLYEQEEDDTDRFHRHIMEWVEILGLLLSLVWGVVGLVFFIQLMETLGGLF